MNLIDLTLQKTYVKPINPSPVKQSDEKLAPIATTSLKKPHRPERSHLVKDPFYMAPVNFVTDIYENIVNIKKGMMGKSNDHDLGRINDFAMKAGALGLAGYLFTRAKTPMAKTMELFGFGSFFASMALWPKLFIETPLKAMYGINIHQKYIDHEGRKKMFFQDPQYVPWDLYTSDELAKLGDKLGIPQNIHNRNEVIKRKAQKIALQGNTLWMLTAGFATPLGCSLICDFAGRKFISPLLDNLKMKKAESNLQNIEKIVENAFSKYDPKKLNGLLDLYKDREIDAKIFNMIVQNLLHDDDILGSKAIESQLQNIVSANKDSATVEYVDKFLKFIKDNACNAEDFKILEDSKSVIKNFAGENVNPRKFNMQVKYFLMQNDIDDLTILEFEELVNKFKSQKTNTNVMKLTPDAIYNIKQLDRGLFEFATRKSVIDKYKQTYLGDVAESIAANKWNSITSTFFKTLNVSSEELKKAKLDGLASYDILLDKIQKLVANDEAYKKAVSKIQEEILSFDSLIMPDAANGAPQGVKAKIIDGYTKLLEEQAEKFNKLGFNKITERLLGDTTEQGSLKANLLDQTRRRVDELRNGFYKILHVLDCFKRADDVKKGWDNSKFAQLYRNLSGGHANIPVNPTMRTLEKDLAQFKKIVLSATIADYTTKFGYRNPQFPLYDRMMKLIYSTDFDDATVAALADKQLGGTTFMAAFKKKINDTLSNLGNFVYPHADKVTTRNVAGSVGDILVRDSLAGPRIDEVFRETASNISNSAKWLKMFGGGFVALVGITLLAETFFGRLPFAEVYKRKDKN